SITGTSAMVRTSNRSIQLSDHPQACVPNSALRGETLAIMVGEIYRLARAGPLQKSPNAGREILSLINPTFHGTVG
ncbi:MAG: hypothetical protein AAGF86_11950, partial [Pseudomonadota bacterium]